MKIRALSLVALLVVGCAKGDDLLDGGAAADGGSGPGAGNGPRGGDAPQGGFGPQGGNGPQGGEGQIGGSPPSGGAPGVGGGAPASCGDGSLNGTEVCDGTQLGGATCASQGFDMGNLACNGSCTAFNTAGCSDNCTLANLLTNSGFESGPGGGGWTEASTNFGTPVCDTASCGMGGGTGPFAGTFWAWFGGTNTALETATVSRSVLIPVGTASLSFRFDMPVCEDPGIATDVFTVKIDGTTLFTRTNSDIGCGAVGYELITLDASAFANGANHTLELKGITDDFIDTTNFFVDDVQLLGCQ